MTLKNKKILIIVGGGIAAYKALDLIRLLKKNNVIIKTILTKSGREFVTPLSITTLTKSKTFEDMFDRNSEAEIDHISLSRWADLIIVLPTTANFMRSRKVFFRAQGLRPRTRYFPYLGRRSIDAFAKGETSYTRFGTTSVEIGNLFFDDIVNYSVANANTVYEDEIRGLQETAKQIQRDMIASIDPSLVYEHDFNLKVTPLSIRTIDFTESDMERIVESYLKGETPIPCVQCNQTVKFKDLFEVAKDLNADALITGHYVKSITKNNSTDMYRAIDQNRDQSYFLFNTTKEQLDYLRFPLGGLLKNQTRDIAKKLNLNVADKPDSQDICFVPNGDYASVIERFKPNSFKKGNIKNLDGKVIGVHDGIINYTIGQRKGIKIADTDALYVLMINSDKNEIIVGPKDKLGKKEIEIKNLNLLVKKEEFENNIFVKVRSTGKLLRAKVNLNLNNKGIVILENAEEGISPGQACVFYSKDSYGDKVLGGGWITS